MLCIVTDSKAFDVTLRLTTMHIKYKIQYFDALTHTMAVIADHTD